MNTDNSPNFKYIAALGSTTMKKFSSLKIFLFGLRGTGSEVAKNLLLAMPKQLVIHDEEKVKISDLATNSFLKDSDVNTKTRSDACFQGLQALNPNVELVVHKGDISFEVLSKFNLVIFTDTFSNISRLFEINEFCRTQKEPIGFIYTGTLGLFSFLFVDYGDNFKIYDKDGEPPKWYVIDHISKSDPGIVTLDHNKPHSLNSGDFVRFSDIEGMTELNGPECRPIKVISPTSFCIEDTTEFSEYKRCGRAEEVKVPFVVGFKSFQDSLTTFTDEEFQQEWQDFGLSTPTRYYNLKVTLYTLCMFSKMQQGMKPLTDQALEEERIKQIVNSSRSMLDDFRPGVKFEEFIVRQSLQTSKFQLAPLCSFIGGVAATEALKITGKYTPTSGFFFFDAFSCLPDSGVSMSIPQNILNTRYEDVCAILGESLLLNIQNKKLLLVGGGSTAAEYLKNLALLGIGTGPEGKIIVIDDAKVSKFDFNSYFAFTTQDIGKLKAKLVVEEACKLNEGLHCEYIQGKAEENSAVTEKDELWEGIDGIISAQDYRLSKSYINKKSIFYEKPMMSNAVHGLKGALQSNFPFITDDYRDIIELKHEKYETNLVWNFPYLFEHTVQWATEVFKMCFNKVSEMAKKIIVDKTSFLESEAKKSKISTHHLVKLKILNYLLFEAKELSYEHLILLSRDLYKYLFQYCVAKLISEFPLNAKDSEGRKIWKGYYRFPSEIPLNIEDEYIRTFVESGAKIFAKMLQIKVTDIDIAKCIEQNQATIDFKGIKEEDFKSLLNLLKINQVSYKENIITNIYMDDEDERHLYVDFVASATYLKAKCYDIFQLSPKRFGESKYKVEKIAFNLKLNIPVVNAIIAGLQVLELLKFCLNKTPDQHKNFFFNLGTNKLKAAPLGYLTKKTLEPGFKDYSVWTKLNCEVNETIGKIIERFASEFGKKISRISWKKIMLFDHKTEQSNLDLTPKDILIKEGEKGILDDKKYIMLSYDLGDKELKHFLPKIKYKCTE